jgi:hypothetical protein
MKKTKTIYTIQPDKFDENGEIIWLEDSTEKLVASNELNKRMNLEVKLIKKEVMTTMGIDLPGSEIPMEVLGNVISNFRSHRKKNELVRKMNGLCFYMADRFIKSSKGSLVKCKDKKIHVLIKYGDRACIYTPIDALNFLYPATGESDYSHGGTGIVKILKINHYK